jgi:hypothetical protein
MKGESSKDIHIYSKPDIQKVQNLLRAIISKAKRQGATEQEAVNTARRAIPIGFPSDRLPRIFEGKISLQPTDKEVNALIDQWENEGKVTYLPQQKTQPTATINRNNIHKSEQPQPTATHEYQGLQQPQPIIGCTATEPQNRNKYDLTIGVIYAFQFCIYAILVPTTASIVGTFLRGLESPIDVNVISYAIALSVDFVAIMFLSCSLRATGRRRQENVAISVLVVALNVASLTYVSYLKSQEKARPKILAQEIIVEKKKNSWLESRFRDAPDYKKCLDDPTDCGHDYFKSARTRQRNYNTEIRKLEQLRSWSLDWFHIAYFIFLWILLGLLSLLSYIWKKENQKC